MIKPFANFRKLSKNITDYTLQLSPKDFADRVKLFPELIRLFNSFPNGHLYLHYEGGLFSADLILRENGKTSSFYAIDLSLDEVLKKLNFKSRNMVS